MKKIFQLFTGLAGLGLAAAALLNGRAPEIPPLPFSPYGTVLLDGANIQLNTEVYALCNNGQFGPATVEEYEGVTWYSMEIPGDDPETTEVVEGCLQDDPVHFTIVGREAGQTTTWQEGVSIRVDISSGEMMTPTPTTEVPPTETVTPTETATETPPTETAIPTETPVPDKSHIYLPLVTR